MSSVGILRPSGIITLERDIPQPATGTPGAPTLLPLNVSDGAIEVQWEDPPSRGGSQIWFYIAEITGGPGAMTSMPIDPDQHSYSFSGLSNFDNYTVSVTPFNAKGAGLTVSTTGQPVAGQFDPRFRDWASNVGPQSPILNAVGFLPNAAGRVFSVTNQTIAQTRFPTGSTSSTGTDTVVILANQGAIFQDVEFYLPVHCDTKNDYLVFQRCLFQPGVYETNLLGGTGAALNLAGLVEYCEVISPIDGIWPGYAGSVLLPNGPTTIRYTWWHPIVNPATGIVVFQYEGFPYGGSMLDDDGNVLIRTPADAIQPGQPNATTGLNPDAAMCIAAENFTADHQQIAIEQIVYGSQGGAPNGWQCIGSTDGSNPATLGPLTDLKTWPATAYSSMAAGATGAPFVSGTAILIPVGPTPHGDSMQATGGGGVVIYRNRIDGYSNSCLLLQSNAIVPSPNAPTFTASATEGDNVLRNVTGFTCVAPGMIVQQTSSAVVYFSSIYSVSHAALVLEVDTVAGTITLDRPAQADGTVSLISRYNVPSQKWRLQENMWTSANAIYWVGVAGLHGVGNGDILDSERGGVGGLAVWAAGTGPYPENTDEYWLPNAWAFCSHAWFVQALSNYWGRSVTSQSNVGVLPATADEVLTPGNASVYVRTIDDLKAGLAAQFPNATSDDLDAMVSMRESASDPVPFDWSNTANGLRIYGNGGANINHAVLQQRRRNGIPIGRCDARTWIVWDPETNLSWDPTTGAVAPLYPTAYLVISRAVVLPGETATTKVKPQGFDNDGFYLPAVGDAMTGYTPA